MTWFKNKSQLPAEVEEALKSPEKVILYSLEPTRAEVQTEGKLHNFRILGHAELDAKDSVTAIEEFKGVVDRWDGKTMRCFGPRHALRVTSDGHTYDLLLCCGCNWMLIYRDDKELESIGVTGSPKLLNELFTAARVPVSTSDSGKR